MSSTESTCWTVIGGAASGNVADQDLFARRYAPAVRAYLAALWRDSVLAKEVEDTAQEVMLECFRQGGALERLDPELASSFRAYLFGITRNVARNAERRALRRQGCPLPSDDALQLADHDEAPSRAFDRAWARALLREAAELQVARAAQMGPDATEGAELLRLHFQEGIAISDIARRWGRNPKELYRAHARARSDFESALQDVLASYHGGSKAAVAREWATLRELIP